MTGFSVAMDLPTRPTGVRLAWAGLALTLLVLAAVSLSLDGTSPVALLWAPG